MRLSAFLCAAIVFSFLASGQTLQKGIDANAKGAERIRVEYVGYRAATCETKNVVEPQNDRPNAGGLVYVYLTNVSDTPIQLAFWRMNGKDESYWRLDGPLAWDRTYKDQLEPGETTVCEIDGVTADFAPGKPFKFSYVDRHSWEPICRHETVLREDPVQISCIRVLPGLAELEIHLRNTSKSAVELESLAVAGHNVIPTDWAGRKMNGVSTAIARVKLDKPLAPSELIIASVGLKDAKGERAVFAHRRAFEDWFPIGVWSNNERTWALLRHLHIDTVVNGGRADNDFFSKAVPKYGFHAIVGAGQPIDVDQMRSLSDHQAVACWMLADEPDWSMQPVLMLFQDRIARQYNSSKPTFLTLCRNTKFFEYAPIADIPCMDHYAVTAPTSSEWPHPYGTHLEETGYYTRDLKAASEPKPIWVWSQAIAAWSERPKRPVPTPNELAAQLMLNLGRGAKGIIWFNYDEKVGEKYTDTRDAMGQWGRVMSATRDDFLASEPYAADIKAPEKVDVAALATWDKVLLCVTNLDYEIDLRAYPFKVKKDVKLTVSLPDWIDPKSAMIVGPDGVQPIERKRKSGKVKISIGNLEACKLVVLANDARASEVYKLAFGKALEEEKREY